MKDLKDMTSEEIINSFPPRHPHLLKCLMYFYFVRYKEIPWEALNQIMRTLGFVKMDVSVGNELYALSSPTWVHPDDAGAWRVTE